MPIFEFEAMDKTGQEISDEIEAPSEDEAQATIRQMGYFITKIHVKKQRGAAAKTGAKTKRARGFSLGGVSGKLMTTFTRQLSILQDAGLPILRSINILGNQCKPGPMKNALLDVSEEIEGGATLSEAMAKSPRVFNRLYVNMIKAGEAGGALEVILQRLADFQERSQALRRQIQGAMIYPVMVVLVAVGILTFIMLKIVPSFQKIFADFGTKLPAMTELLIMISENTYKYWFLIPGIPIAIVAFIQLVRKFKAGKMGWDLFLLKLPIMGMLVEKNVLARTTRTLGTLVSSGVPILEALTITRETAGNAMFERLYGKISESIRDGETISKPMKVYSVAPLHPVTMFFWCALFAGPMTPVWLIPGVEFTTKLSLFGVAIGLGAAICYFRMKSPVVDDMVINMIDVGEETGELDTMLYKVADTYDDEVRVLTEGLTKLMEPLLIIFLGGAVGFIVIALFMPLITLIQDLS